MPSQPAPMLAAIGGPTAICVVALIGLVALLATGRIRWRWGAMMFVGGCLVFCGEAIADSLQTAIAISS